MVPTAQQSYKYAIPLIYH